MDDGGLTGAQWRTSSYSGGNGGTCVEVADNLPGVIAVRDSKDPGRPGAEVQPERLVRIRGGDPRDASGGVGGDAVADDEALDLAHRVARQVVPDLDLTCATIEA
jgi:hypothetical protein